MQQASFTDLMRGQQIQYNAVINQLQQSLGRNTGLFPGVGNTSLTLSIDREGCALFNQQLTQDAEMWASRTLDNMEPILPTGIWEQMQANPNYRYNTTSLSSRFHELFENDLIWGSSNDPFPFLTPEERLKKENEGIDLEF